MKRLRFALAFKTAALIGLLHVPSCLHAQDDFIIFRNGEDKHVQLVMVSSDEVTYRESANGENVTKNKLKDIYMLHYAKRGNVYITEDCKRITGENQKIDKDADVIYLVKGGEIMAYDLKIQENSLVYGTKPKNAGLFGKKVIDNQLHSIDLKDVFIIKYRDGTKDLINDISAEYKEAEEKARMEAEEKARAEEELKKINETKVIFHHVKKGETLAIVAKRYHVTCNEIIEWNDLPKATKQNSKLRPEMQLMIYVKNANQ